jgi:hypothetical protein
MSSLPTWRAVFALMLVLSVLAWFEPLSTAPMGSGTRHCHPGTETSSQHDCGRPPAASHSCHPQMNSTPCCPTHSEKSPQHCGNGYECCVLDREAPRPTAILLSSQQPKSKQSQAARPVAGLGLPLWTRVLLLSRSTAAVPYLQPVDQKKTDLRI